MSGYKLRKRYQTDEQNQELADFLLGVIEDTGLDTVSARGICYLLEGKNMIDKSQFNKVESKVTKLIKEGFLPVDFVSQDVARGFHGVINFEGYKPEDVAKYYLGQALKDHEHLTANWWDDEEYYIQMLVEKSDLVSLFKPVCEKYKIPIANAKGWSSILQRAEYCRRFKEAEERGLQCVLLYCGDLDPGGMLISENLHKNLSDLEGTYWKDGETGYNPDNLIIDRFGLNYDFIIENGLTWIDNLITGNKETRHIAKVQGGKIVPGSNSREALTFFNRQVVQQYLKAYGVRKVEANALIVVPEAAEQLCEDSILKYLGEEAPERFHQKMVETQGQYEEYLRTSGKYEIIKQLLE